MTKTCNKCNMEGLEWDTSLHETKGIWRLSKDGVPHICRFKKSNKYRLDTKFDLTNCGLCRPSHYGWCRHDDLVYHNLIFHPNKEIKVWQKWQ